MSGAALALIYEAIRSLGGQPECTSCRRCEENVGLVYLLEDEAQQAKRRTLPVISVGKEAHYFSRTSHGWCPCFNPESNTCEIYNDRPLCCRLYPLDLGIYRGEAWWVLHGECPIAQRWVRERYLDAVATLLEHVEDLLDPSILRNWISQEKTSVVIESLELEELHLIRIRPIRI